MASSGSVLAQLWSAEPSCETTQWSGWMGQAALQVKARLCLAMGTGIRPVLLQAWTSSGQPSREGSPHQPGQHRAGEWVSTG